MPQSFQPPSGQAACFRKIAGAGSLQDIVDFGLERTAVGLCGRLELLQDVIIEVTNQYIGHSQVEPPYARWYQIDTGLSGAPRTAGIGLVDLAARPGMTREPDKSPRTTTGRAPAGRVTGAIYERPVAPSAIERGSAEEPMEIVLCSDCFQDSGLRLDAEGLGIATDGTCPVCRSEKGMKLDVERVTYDVAL